MNIGINLLKLGEQFGQIAAPLDDKFFYKNPVFIVSTPRSGSNLLFEQLSNINNVWTIGGESHNIFAEFPHLKFENDNQDSGCLNAIHADQNTAYYFKLAIYCLLRNNRNSKAFMQPIKNGVFLEKTPRNSLNIPFLMSLFPKAKFIYLYREPKQNVSSIIEAWHTGLNTGQFVTYSHLNGWDKKHWCLLLPKNWRALNGKSIAEIACFQWKASNNKIMTDLKELPPSKWTSLEYKSLVNKPYKSIKKLAKFCGINEKLNKSTFENLSLSKTSISKPNKNKWKKHKDSISPFLADLESLYEEVKVFCNNK
jgi:hypothetical protein